MHLFPCVHCKTTWWNEWMLPLQHICLHSLYAAVLYVLVGQIKGVDIYKNFFVPYNPSSLLSQECMSDVLFNCLHTEYLNTLVDIDIYAQGQMHHGPKMQMHLLAGKWVKAQRGRASVHR